MTIPDRSASKGITPGSTATSERGLGWWPWFKRIRRRLNVALGRKADPATFLLVERAVADEPGRDVLIERLASGTKPERLAALLNEALTFLEAADRRVVVARLSGDDESTVASRLEVAVGQVGPLYAMVVDRLVERLAWVVAEEARGISPPERNVVGHARFLGQSAQEIARRLRLPEEVVQSWLRAARLPATIEPGVPR